MNIGRRIVQEEQNGAARAEYGKFCLKFKVLSIQQPLLAEFVQPAVGRIESSSSLQNDSEIVQPTAAQIETISNNESVIVQTVSAQLPKILSLTTSKTNQLWTLRN